MFIILAEIFFDFVVLIYKEKFVKGNKVTPLRMRPQLKIVPENVNI